MRNAPIEEAIILNDQLPDKLFRSYCRLMTAAWNHNYRRTDPLSLETLMQLLSLSRSRTLEHLGQLRLAGLIHWTTNGARRYVITFHSRLAPAALPVVDAPQAGSAGPGLDIPPKDGDYFVETSPAGAPGPGLEDEGDVSKSRLREVATSGLRDLEDDEDISLSTGSLHHPLLQESRSLDFETSRRRLVAALMAGRLDPAESEDFAGKILSGVIQLTLADVLENVAYVHDPASRVEKPASIMRIHVKAGRRSPKKYRLPDDFDEALRLAPMTPQERLEDARRRQAAAMAASPDEPLAVVPAEDETPPPAPCDQLDAQRAWQAVLGEISLATSRPTFKTLIEPAVLVAHDEAENRFTLAVKTDFIRGWLQGRLRSSFERSLAGITGRPVTVTIVTWSEWAAMQAAKGDSQCVA